MKPPQLTKEVIQLRSDVDKLTNGMIILLKELRETQSALSEVYMKLYPNDFKKAEHFAGE